MHDGVPVNTPPHGGAGVAIELPGPLVESRFITRPNRFLLHCHIDGCEEEVHLADPGRLNELLLPGRRVWVRPAAAPGRRTRWSAVLVESPAGDGLVSVDTTLPNRLIQRALREDALSEFEGWSLERHEFTPPAELFDRARTGGRRGSVRRRRGAPRSRIDFLLRDGDGRSLAVEVKSVTLVEDGVALFPDAVTARGARHVRELAEIALLDDWEAAVLFVLQRPDADRIRAASSIDPVFAEALAGAEAAGVRVLGRRCHVDLSRVRLGEPVPAGAG